GGGLAAAERRDLLSPERRRADAFSGMAEAFLHADRRIPVLCSVPVAVTLRVRGRRGRHGPLGGSPAGPLCDFTRPDVRPPLTRQSAVLRYLRGAASANLPRADLESRAACVIRASARRHEYG